MKKLLCWLAIAFFSNIALAVEPELEQTHELVGAPLLRYAQNIAEADGHKDPKLLVGLLKVESNAGDTDVGFRVVKQTGSIFYGVAQLTIGAAKTVMTKFPELWTGFNTKTEEELKARLILDDKFSVRVASKYLVLVGARVNPEKAVAAYQVGIGGVELIDYKQLPYLHKVKSKSR